MGSNGPPRRFGSSPGRRLASSVGAPRISHSPAFAKSFGGFRARSLPLTFGTWGDPMPLLSIHVEDLEGLTNEIRDLLARFQDGGSIDGYFLRSSDAARFQGLVTEAKAILNGDAIRYGDFVTQIIFATSGSGDGSPSYACVERTEQILRAAIRQAKRNPLASPMTAATAKKENFVDPNRIAEIERLTRPDGEWDFAKLARLCRELNTAHENDCYYSVAMLCRAIVDHVPPVFQAKTFKEFAAQIAVRSMKELMQHLEGGLRKIAGLYLHDHIRKKESRPGPVGVDYRQQIDLLLGEVVRVAQP